MRARTLSVLFSPMFTGTMPDTQWIFSNHLRMNKFAQSQLVNHFSDIDCTWQIPIYKGHNFHLYYWPASDFGVTPSPNRVLAHDRQTQKLYWINMLVCVSHLFLLWSFIVAFFRFFVFRVLGESYIVRLLIVTCSPSGPDTLGYVCGKHVCAFSRSFSESVCLLEALTMPLAWAFSVHMLMELMV